MALMSHRTETKTVTPKCFCISGTSNPLSACSKNLKKFYRLEKFRANVLKLPIYSSVLKVVFKPRDSRLSKPI